MKPLMIATFCAALALAAELPKGVQRGASVEGITEYRLDNGLRVLLFPDASSPKTTINITYLVGAKHENYGETGMAHLLEHMVFKSTPTRADILAEITRRATAFNGTTGFDRTNYYETFPATPGNLEWALRLEADRMVNAHIAKEALDKEMTVVRNEYEAGENSAFNVLLKRLYSVAYDWHNYANAPIGARSDIENVPVERLRAFYRKYYQPDNAVLVIAGRFDADEALTLVAGAFGPIPRPTRPLERLWTSEPTQDGERIVTVRRAGSAQNLMAAYHVPATAHPDNAALEALGHLLTNQPSGRLYKALVETKIATSATTFSMPSAEPGLRFFAVGVRKSDSLETARQTLFRVLDDLATEAPTAEEVERAKASSLAEIKRAMNDSQAIAIGLSEAVAAGDWRLLFLTRDQMAKVTPADVARVARQYLKADNRTVGLFVPVDKPERAEIPATPDIRAMVENYRGSAAVAAGEEFNPTPENVEKRVRRVTLANGTKVVLLEKKTRGEKVIGRITLRSGDLESLRGKNETAIVAWNLLMRGSATLTGQQIADRLNQLQSRLTMGGSTVFGAANFESTRGQVGNVVKLTAELLRAPKFEEKEFDTLRGRFIAGVEQARSQPESLATSALMKQLNPREPGHPHFSSDTDEIVQALKNVTLDGVKAYHRDFFGAGPGAVITVVGDFDGAAMEAALREEFGAWTARHRHILLPDETLTVAALEKQIDTPDKANAMFAAGVRFSLNENSQSYAAVTIANQIFGQGTDSRLFNRMRKKEGWSYGAGTTLVTPVVAPDARLMAQAIVSPENVTKLIAAFREELVRAVKEGFTAEELAHAKRQWLQQRAAGRTQDMGLLNALAHNEYWQRTMAWDAALESKVDSLTLDEVNAAFRSHVDPAKFSVVVAGDLKKAGLAQ